jgi:ubiquitin-activating enzyme E1
MVEENKTDEKQYSR